jgi:hypothetical protein
MLPSLLLAISESSITLAGRQRLRGGRSTRISWLRWRGIFRRMVSRCWRGCGASRLATDRCARDLFGAWLGAAPRMTHMDAHTVIANAIGTHPIVLFMNRNGCGVLQNYDVPIHSVDVLDDPAIRRAIKTYSNWPTIRCSPESLQPSGLFFWPPI